MKLEANIVLLSIVCSLQASAEFKTVFPEKVPTKIIKQAPYRYNGVVISQTGRGSGFHAWNEKTFFSAAHVIFTNEEGKGPGWQSPPAWYPRAHTANLDNTPGLQARGYARWESYAALATNNLLPSHFSKDVVLCYALKPIAKGKPAAINMNGMGSLMAGEKFTITGYPVENFYLDEPIDDDVIDSTSAFHMFRTKPFRSKFKKFSDRAIFTTLITTGRGNSGGPVWTKNSRNQWTASGVLVGGRPSETIVYAFSSGLNPLLRSVRPIVSSPKTPAVSVADVENTAMFFPFKKKQVIPDGKLRWTNFRVGANSIRNEQTVKYLKLNVDIRTPHRGDLYIMLSSPEGINVIVHNEQGANAKDLIIKNLDLTKHFVDAIAIGPWTLRVQDRLKGDICEFRSFRLEIGVHDTNGDSAGGGNDEDTNGDPDE